MKKVLFLTIAVVLSFQVLAQRNNRISYNVINASNAYAPLNLAYERSVHPNIGIEIGLARFKTPSLNPGSGQQNIPADTDFNTGDLVTNILLDALFNPGSDPQLGTIQAACNQRGTMFTVGPKFYFGSSIRGFIQPEWQYYAYNQTVFTQTNSREYDGNYAYIKKSYNSRENVSAHTSTGRINTGLQVNFKSGIAIELGASIGRNIKNKEAQDKKRKFDLPPALQHASEYPFRHSIALPVNIKLEYAF